MSLTAGTVLGSYEILARLSAPGLDLATGERQLLRKITFPDLGGILTPTNLLLTPDGRSYAFTYGRFLSTLYLVEGLK